jgi:hypothetical protein
VLRLGAAHCEQSPAKLAGVISPTQSQGTHLGTIATGAQTTNVAWGNADWSTLYFATWSTLGCIRTKIPGIPVPRGRV